MSSPATTWREKLHECETQGDSESRIGWLRRTYARIYRFLISQYDEPPPEVEHPPMPFVDSTDELDGKAARSLGEIRHTLKDISANQPLDASSQVLRDKEIWVTVAVEGRYLRDVASPEWLGGHGIEARVIREGRRRVVRVRREDADEVFRLIAQEKELPFFLRSSPRPSQLDEATLQRRARFARAHCQLGLLAFSLCWGVLICALLLRQVGVSNMEAFIVIAAMLCVLTLTEFGLHLMRRSR
jgi:hypothetical protein